MKWIIFKDIQPNLEWRGCIEIVKIGKATPYYIRGGIREAEENYNLGHIVRWLDETDTDLEVLWDQYSEQIDADIDSLSYWAGRIVMQKSDFERALKSL